MVTPGHADRQQLAMNAVDAAVAARVGYVLVISVFTSGTDSIFGRQFSGLEAHIKKAGIKYGILRLPFFLDNLWGSQGNIKNEGCACLVPPAILRSHPVLSPLSAFAYRCGRQDLCAVPCRCPVDTCGRCRCWPRRRHHSGRSFQAWQQDLQCTPPNASRRFARGPSSVHCARFRGS